MRTKGAVIQLWKTATWKLLESDHLWIPSYRSQFDHAAQLWTPSAASTPSCCRFGTWGWATTQMRLFYSSIAAARVPVRAPTTTSPSPTCCSLDFSPAQCPGSCGTMHPAAGPPTTRTWPFLITRTDGIRWKSCQLPAAAAWARWLRVNGYCKRGTWTWWTCNVCKWMNFCSFVVCS